MQITYFLRCCADQFFKKVTVSERRMLFYYFSLKMPEKLMRFLIAQFSRMYPNAYHDN